MDGTVVKTWARDSQISPEMIGFTFGVHNGKDFIQVRITEDMIGHRLGEFSPTRKFVKHGGKMQKEIETKKKESEIASAQAAKAAPEKSNMKEITAKLNNYRASPRKTRIVASLIKGKKVKDAIVQLDFLAKKSANPIAKLLKSAISNAKNDFKVVDENNLIDKDNYSQCRTSS